MPTSVIRASRANEKKLCSPGQMHYMYAVQGTAIIVTEGVIDLTYREGRLDWLLGDAVPISQSLNEGSAFVMPCGATITVSAPRKKAAFFIEEMEDIAGQSPIAAYLAKVLRHMLMRAPG